MIRKQEITLKQYSQNTSLILGTKYKGRAFLNAALYCACFCLTGCFQMGLPEQFAKIGPQQTSMRTSLKPLKQLSKQPRAIVITPTLGSLDVSERTYLGHQYLMAFFPFTSVFLQHNPETLLTELSIDSFVEKGYTAYLASEDSYTQVAKSIRPSVIIHPQLKDLSVNAYDAIFLRAIHVSGELVVDYISPNTEQPKLSTKQIRIDISDTLYKKQAHAPTLSYLMEKNIKHALDSALTRIPRQRPHRNDPAVVNGNRILLIPPPIWQTSLTSDFGQRLMDSYGFRHLPPYSANSIARIIQRGLTSGLRGKNITTSPTTATTDRVSHNGPITWELATAVKSLSVKNDQEITLRIEFTLREFSPETGKSNVSKHLCSTTIPKVSKGDGIWVLTLEEASAQLSAAMFSPNVNNQVCQAYY